MDVKGAYLNGILQEKVYMRQPEGFEDGTDRVCELVKTICGLKQSGREWNKEFDNKIKSFGFHQLKSDPCVYVRHDTNGVSIITVWVDDLLLFASSDEAMQQMKTDIRSVAVAGFWLHVANTFCGLRKKLKKKKTENI
jgi:reverse transcriptase-like protein